MIALATADLSAQSFDDIDRPFLENAFTGRAEFVIWDDPNVDWSAYDLVVLRSTWDYSYRLPEFTAWLRSVEQQTRMLNAATTVTWNLDKTYLGALGELGVPVVPTSYLVDLAEFDRRTAALPSAEIVVKPTISAGSDLTGRFQHGDPAGRELAEQILGRGKTVMLQPYFESVTEQGEIAVVHLNGQFSHAFRKGPLLEVGGSFLGGEYTEVVEAVRPSEAVLAAVDAALAGHRQLAQADPARAGEEPLLYSRTDLILDPDGAPRCLELELIEPSLFFETDDQAATRFVQAVLQRL